MSKSMLPHTAASVWSESQRSEHFIYRGDYTQVVDARRCLHPRRGVGVPKVPAGIIIVLRLSSLDSVLDS